MPHVVPITTADYPTPAKRPAYSVLDTTRLQQDFEIRPAAWQDGLGSVLDDIARTQTGAERPRDHMGSEECDFW